MVAHLPATAIPKLLRQWQARRRHPAWVFGGAIRDLLLGGQPQDWDLAIADPHGAREAAETLARAARGTWFQLNETFQLYRVLHHGRQYDLQPLASGGLEAFLKERDFSINAMAVAIPGPSGVAAAEVMDPTAGIRDLDRKTLRSLPGSLAADPVRLLRGLRIALQLHLKITAPTMAAMATSAPHLWESAGERIRDELFRILSFWPQRPALVLKALDLVLGPGGRGRGLRLRRLRLAGIPASRHPLLLLAASLAQGHAETGRRLRLTRPMIRFLTRWETLPLRRGVSETEWRMLLASSPEPPVELNRLAAAAGRPQLRRMAERHEDFAHRLGPALLTGVEAARLSGASGPALGRLLAKLRVQQALGRVRTAREARAWVRRA